MQCEGENIRQLSPFSAQDNLRCQKRIGKVSIQKEVGIMLQTGTLVRIINHRRTDRRERNLIDGGWFDLDGDGLPNLGIDRQAVAICAQIGLKYVECLIEYLT